MPALVLTDGPRRRDSSPRNIHVSAAAWPIRRRENSTRRDTGVPLRYAYQSCGPACRTCGLPESCGADDAAWYKASEPAKTCAWVGAATGVRCDALGADGKLAYEACPAACRACGDAFGECADDVDFFKKGDPAKGCEWIASTTDAAVKAQRCLAKGEDAGYAFLACPVACGTC